MLSYPALRSDHALHFQVCLPLAVESDFAGQEAVVTGWGTTASGGDLSEVLREVTVGVISNQVLRGTFNFTVVGK